MPREQREDTTAHTMGGRPSFRAPAGAVPAFRRPSRCLGVLVAAIACLAPAAPVCAQHPAPQGASAPGAAQTRAADAASLRPFHLTVPDKALIDLRRRIAATRWSERETVDEMLDDITFYWLTNTGTSGARLYWETNANNVNAVGIAIPAAVTVFPGEISRPPKSWTERAYHQLIYYHRVDKGGHFAAWEQPQLFAEEILAAFRSLRESWHVEPCFVMAR